MNLVVEFRLSRNVSVSQLRCHEKFPVEMKLNTKRLRENLFSSHENLSIYVGLSNEGSVRRAHISTVIPRIYKKIYWQIIVK